MNKNFTYKSHLVNFYCFPGLIVRLKPNYKRELYFVLSGNY